MTQTYPHAYRYHNSKLESHQCTHTEPPTPKYHKQTHTRYPKHTHSRYAKYSHIRVCITAIFLPATTTLLMLIADLDSMGEVAPPESETPPHERDPEGGSGRLLAPPLLFVLIADLGVGVLITLAKISMGEATRRGETGREAVLFVSICTFVPVKQVN